MTKYSQVALPEGKLPDSAELTSHMYISQPAPTEHGPLHYLGCSLTPPCALGTERPAERTSPPSWGRRQQDLACSMPFDTQSHPPPLQVHLHTPYPHMQFICTWGRNAHTCAKPCCLTECTVPASASCTDWLPVAHQSQSEWLDTHILVVCVSLTRCAVWCGCSGVDGVGGRGPMQPSLGIACTAAVSRSVMQCPQIASDRQNKPYGHL